MDTQESFHKGETLALIGRYATPLALILIGSGILFAPMGALPRRIAVVLFVVSMFLNITFLPLISRLSERARSILAKSRATVNLWINIVLVYLLGLTWPLIWLLLSLSSVATAIYGTRERTVVTAVFLSAVLVVINSLHHLFTLYDWALVAVKAAFIILASLMVNDLAHPRKTDG